MVLPKRFLIISIFTTCTVALQVWTTCPQNKVNTTTVNGIAVKNEIIDGAASLLHGFKETTTFNKISWHDHKFSYALHVHTFI